MSTPRVVARIFAVLLIALFVTVLPLLLLAYNAATVALSPGFLDRVVSDTRLYEGALTEAADSLARELPTEADTRGLAIARLDAQSWERILTVVAPPGSVRDWVSEAVQEFRHWRWGDDSVLDDVVIPYGKMRNNLVNDPAQTALHAVTEAQPLCADGEEPLAGTDDLIPRCRPADLEAFYAGLSARWQAESAAVWQQLWPEEVSRYADDITLGELIRSQDGRSWSDIRTAWRLAGWSISLARWLAILVIAGGVVVTLAIIAALAARNGAEVLRWVGGPLLLAGLFTLGWGLVMLVGSWTVPAWSDPADITQAMREALRDVAQLFTQRMFVPMAWQGGLMTLVGLLVWGLSFLIRRPRPQE